MHPLDPAFSAYLRSGEAYVPPVHRAQRVDNRMASSGDVIDRIKDGLRGLAAKTSKILCDREGRESIAGLILLTYLALQAVTALNSKMMPYDGTDVKTGADVSSQVTGGTEGR